MFGSRGAFRRGCHRRLRSPPNAPPSNRRRARRCNPRSDPPAVLRNRPSSCLRHRSHRTARARNFRVPASTSGQRRNTGRSATVARTAAEHGPATTATRRSCDGGYRSRAGANSYGAVRTQRQSRRIVVSARACRRQHSNLATPQPYSTVHSSHDASSVRADPRSVMLSA